MRSLTILLCFLAFGAQAEVYKWIDSSGRVQFSDQPPPASQGKAQRMNLNESRVTTVSARAAASQASSVQAQVQPSAPPTKPPRDEAACAAAEKRLSFLKNANLFKQVSNDQGKVEFLPAKQREQEIVERTAFIEKNCR
ncbi:MULTISPECIES: DUF4124 domain-containing protein [Deefgea]|nr:MULTISPECIES: DUF4124 domain-containing protein [Deefgea]MBM9887760.1 DUF4124 domain-containing protein [Deefgea sp. CFH1-16]